MTLLQFVVWVIGGIVVVAGVRMIVPVIAEIVWSDR